MTLLSHSLVTQLRNSCGNNQKLWKYFRNYSTLVLLGVVRPVMGHPPVIAQHLRRFPITPIIYLILYETSTRIILFEHTKHTRKRIVCSKWRTIAFVCVRAQFLFHFVLPAQNDVSFRSEAVLNRRK